MPDQRHLPSAVNVGDEGGFAPNIDNVEECLELICTAVKASGHWEKVRIALDVAASGMAPRRPNL